VVKWVYICRIKNKQAMAHINNQNIFHATLDGKKTICGLSNQFNDADSLVKFAQRLKDSSFIKYCCKKCQTKI
jgi:hypothetical protein